MLLSLIACAARNGVIGKDNALPWRVKADLKRFRAYTTGKPVVMGRTTFASIGDKPLPKRTNLILSRSLAPGVHDDGHGVYVVVADLDAALAHVAGVDEVVVCGGAAVYALAQARAQRFVLTVLDADIDGDSVLPALDARWCFDPAAVADVSADVDNSHAMRFYDLWRSGHGPATATTPVRWTFGALPQPL